LAKYTTGILKRHRVTSISEDELFEIGNQVTDHLRVIVVTQLVSLVERQSPEISQDGHQKTQRHQYHREHVDDQENPGGLSTVHHHCV